MKKLNFESLDKLLENKNDNAINFLRVGMDTGGIAAGADKVFKTLHQEKQRLGLAIEVQQTGSNGLVFADPVVEVQYEGLPTISYGNVTDEVAEKLIESHVVRKKLLDDHIIATRDRKTSMKEECFAIIVKDTSCEDGDKTLFFQASIEEKLREKKLNHNIQVVRAFDMGIYDEGLSLQLLPSGITYTNVLTKDIDRIIDATIEKNETIQDLLYDEPDLQHKIVLRNCGKIDPESIENYLENKGYQGLKKLLKDKEPDQAIHTLKSSAIRGRGGAGFPTHLKWKFTREAEGDEKYVICNADEGDPGAFMDRSILEGDPHSVLEGLIIAAYCIGAQKGYFYIRAEYPLAVKRVQMAIDQAKEKGLLGDNILGSNFSFDAEIRLGAGAFVCGEETALIASIEGKRGSPSPRPPYPAISGLWGKPTNINNVETLAAIPVIFTKGGKWYSQYGTESSKGTKVFAVTGKIANAQLVEVPMGVSLHDVVFKICGGVQDKVEIKGVQTGGPSGGVIPDKHLNTAISYETFQKLGSIMGSGGMLVMDENDSMVDVAKFYLKFCVDESCGKCAPCRIGGFQMLQILEKIFRGRGHDEDIEQLRNICSAMQKASLCGLGQTAPNPVLSTLRYFEDEYRSLIEGGTAYAKKLKKKLQQISEQAS